LKTQAINRELTKITLKDFLSYQDPELSDQMAKMVYGNEQIVEEIEKLISKSQYLVNETQTECLKQLETIANSQVLIVTDPELMRGFDYRSTVGIALLITSPF